jgi:RimJ/RimL family protein N-acetyltransferase
VLRPVSLTGEEVTLDPLRPEDAAELAPLLDDPLLHRFIGGEPLSPGELEARYRRLAAGSPSGSDAVWLNWTIRRRADTQAVGTAQATVVGATAQLAWVVASRWQGRGYASDAALALVKWAAEHGLTATAHVDPSHTASERVASHAGLRPTSDWVDGERVWRSAGSPETR